MEPSLTCESLCGTGNISASSHRALVRDAGAGQARDRSVAYGLQRGQAAPGLRPHAAGALRLRSSAASCRQRPAKKDPRVKFINPAEMFQTGGAENGGRSLEPAQADAAGSPATAVLNQAHMPVVSPSALARPLKARPRAKLFMLALSAPAIATHTEQPVLSRVDLRDCSRPTRHDDQRPTTTYAAQNPGCRATGEGERIASSMASRTAQATARDGS